ncbi:D-alanine--D-alanine ligase [Caminicella sporogenes DSM 14501]|uniref:D-alanine--D-alanine ligase n=1 Tax=Caminicella sporogenes DSM 14501 TaxID=1121266 RepID=A0A1M6PP86_9FIRM|nr:D-alanine--D-alanine ligase [Caminicella sporogenes]RKD22030.1 D-alanine--D-alanine ligase A [Caminicella sporogenes]SHK09776.1 D-alanine--D-alanine ligase [Caminicella sporogenes DSM 14501]
MENKINVGIIFGGKSAEHEVSLMSAASIMRAIDKEKYNVIPIGITKRGNWMMYDGPIEKIENGQWENISNKLIKDRPEENIFSVIPIGDKSLGDKIPPVLIDKIDVVFPVLHGPYGEDGTIQGLLEMADIPYVGAGVLASSLCMDKVYAKKIFEFEGLSVVDYFVIFKDELEKNIKDYISAVEKNFNYPVFIKPANLGSSVGITKAHNRDELINGLHEAAKYDRKIMVEKCIECREIECAVLGNDKPKASVVGEIIPSHEFYDYEAKYFDDGKSKMVIPADIPEEISDKIRKIAVKAYKALECSGLSRVDFFLEKGTNKIYINEINTMPGFTKYSMYPLLWQETGLPYDKLIDKLIQLALERYKQKP